MGRGNDVGVLGFILFLISILHECRVNVLYISLRRCHIFM